MNVEQAVLENLRLLPTAKQRDVLLFVQSLLPSEQATFQALRLRLIEEVLPLLGKIQRFHDGLPSAVYANRLLRTMHQILELFPDEPLTQFIQFLFKILSTDNHWSQYPTSYYRQVYILLNDLVTRFQLEDEAIQLSIQALDALSTDMLQSANTIAVELDEVDDW
jgi:hypothetical protein